MKSINKKQHAFPTKLATGATASMAAFAFAAFSMQVSAVGTEDSINQKPLSAEFKKLDQNS
ncbi:MAG: hypothetical protein U1E13_13230, partial [Methylophilaceae bacterium]|nr:hypothetical protein [Methylophilaceae bacterium]